MWYHRRVADDALQPSVSIAKAVSSRGWPSVRGASVCARLLLVRLVGLVLIGVCGASLLPRLVSALSDPHLLSIFERQTALGHAGNFVTWLGSGLAVCYSGAWVVEGPLDIAGIAAGVLLYFGRTQTMIRFLGRSKQ